MRLLLLSSRVCRNVVGEESIVAILLLLFGNVQQKKPQPSLFSLAVGIKGIYMRTFIARQAPSLARGRM